MSVLTKDNDSHVAALFNKFACKKVQPSADLRTVQETDPVIVDLKAEAAQHGFSVELYPLVDLGMDDGGEQDCLMVHFYTDHNNDVRIQNLELEDFTF